MKDYFHSGHAMDAQQYEDHILIFHVMERRNCALIMLKRVGGGSQDIIRCIPNKQHRAYHLIYEEGACGVSPLNSF